MVDPKDLIGQSALYGGASTACATAPVAISSQSIMLTALSAGSALIGVLGFAYTVWNGNRNYQLQLRQLELREKELQLEVK